MLAYNHTKILISLWKFEEIILHQKEVGGKGNIWFLCQLKPLTVTEGRTKGR
jgi:hypothetical protein